MISEILYLEYLSNLLEGDKNKCAAIVNHLHEDKIDLKDLYTNLFQRSLTRVGKLWESGRICIATEHMASTITECMLGFSSSRLISIPKNGKKAVITCVPKEFHQIGARMVSDIFEVNGWCSYYLGANVPCGEIYELLDEKKPDVLGLSISIYLNLVRLIDMIDKVRDRYPDLTIIIGGQALDKTKSDILHRYKDVHFINDLDSLERFIKAFNKKSVNNLVSK